MSWNMPLPNLDPKLGQIRKVQEIRAIPLLGVRLASRAHSRRCPVVCVRLSRPPARVCSASLGDVSPLGGALHEVGPGPVGVLALLLTATLLEKTY